MKAFTAKQTVGYCYTDENNCPLAYESAVVLTRVLRPHFTGKSADALAWNFRDVTDALQRGGTFLMDPSAFAQLIGIYIEADEEVFVNVRPCIVDNNPDWRLVTGADPLHSNLLAKVATEISADDVNESAYVAFANLGFIEHELPSPKRHTGRKGVERVFDSDLDLNGDLSSENAEREIHSDGESEFLEQQSSIRQAWEEYISSAEDSTELPRLPHQISQAILEVGDKIWYTRCLLPMLKEGPGNVKPEIWKQALTAGEQVRQKYGEENLGRYTEFEWGMLNGKLSALRWVFGDDWDNLDT